MKNIIKVFIILSFLLLSIQGTIIASNTKEIAIIGFQGHNIETEILAGRLADLLYDYLDQNNYYSPLKQEEMKSFLNKNKLSVDTIYKNPDKDYKLDIDLIIFGFIDNNKFTYYFYNPRSQKRYKNSFLWTGLTSVRKELINKLNEIIELKGVIQNKQGNKVIIKTETTDKLGLWSEQIYYILKPYTDLFPQGIPFINEQIIIATIRIINVNKDIVRAEIIEELYPITTNDFVSQTNNAYQLGNLKLGSTPQKADVYLDNNFLGKTPLFLENIPAKNYTFTFKKNKYESKNKNISVINNKTSYYNVELNPEKGTLHIESNKKATLKINNQIIGNTPLKKKLSPGLYHIKLEAAGYQTISRYIRIKTGEKYYLYLPFLGSPATLKITSQPSQADVFFDGKYIGKTTNIIKNLSPGYYKLELNKEGYLSYTKDILIISGKDKQINVLLEPAPGEFFLSTEPKNAHIFINNKFIGKSPLEFTLPAGTYQLKIEKNSYATKTLNLKANVAESKNLQFKLTPLFATLIIESKPSGALVYNQGRYLGKTPLKIKHAAEKQEFSLQKDNLTSSKKVYIYPDEINKQYFILTKEKEINLATLFTYVPNLLMKGINLELGKGQKHYFLVEFNHLFAGNNGGFSPAYTHLTGSYQYFYKSNFAFYISCQQIVNPYKLRAYSSGIILQIADEKLQIKLGPYFNEELTGLNWEIRYNLTNNTSPILNIKGNPNLKLQLGFGFNFKF